MVTTNSTNFVPELELFGTSLEEFNDLVRKADRPEEEIRPAAMAVLAKAIQASKPVIPYVEREVRDGSLLWRGVLVGSRDRYLLTRGGSILDRRQTISVALEYFDIPGNNSAEVIEWVAEFLKALQHAFQQAARTIEERKRKLDDRAESMRAAVKSIKDAQATNN